MAKPNMYSVGDCPVCPGAGPLLVLLTSDRSKAIYFCPFCETAWCSHPGNEVNEIKSLDAHAPEGVVPPSWHDLKVRGIERLVVKEVPYGDWQDELDRILGGPEALAET
ncbi:MAG: hypothetical protein H0T76_13650 [Nannocystis sp.]|nr:hypothetical protein [Nannocystis sp.]MBA3547523.1 hypothetical protein [Nannocystis sp.]